MKQLSALRALVCVPRYKAEPDRSWADGSSDDHSTLVIVLVASPHVCKDGRLEESLRRVP